MKKRWHDSWIDFLRVEIFNQFYCVALKNKMKMETKEDTATFSQILFCYDSKKLCVYYHTCVFFYFRDLNKLLSLWLESMLDQSNILRNIAVIFFSRKIRFFIMCVFFRFGLQIPALPGGSVNVWKTNVRLLFELALCWSIIECAI